MCGNRSTLGLLKAWQKRQCDGNHNVDLLLGRLQTLDYQPHGGSWGEPTPRAELSAMRELQEKSCLFPLSLRFWIEEAGAVSLLGSHGRLAPQGFASDALMIGGVVDLVGLVEEWEELGEASISFDLIPTAAAKVGILDDFGSDEFLSIQLPDRSADAVLTGDAGNRTLVEYLRWSFQWGGFPGWEGIQDGRPEEELAFLRNGLLEI